LSLGGVAIEAEDAGEDALSPLLLAPPPFCLTGTTVSASVSADGCFLLVPARTMIWKEANEVISGGSF
jgi:hypothetical protein